MTSGYYRFPAIYQDTIVFVCEDDLWTLSRAGGQARRLTANLGEVEYPTFSPDGVQLAFTGYEEGQAEVFLMPSAGGPARRLTFLGDGMCQTLGWTPNGRILFRSAAYAPFFRMEHLYTLDSSGNQPELLNVGPATAVAFGPDDSMIIGRFHRNAARWKRYRGGRAGAFWIDRKGDGSFDPFLEQVNGNIGNPMWINGRIYFLSDHEGIGNLYSCLPSGEDIQRHTSHSDFYARDASSDGQRIVYSAGGDLYLFDPKNESANGQVAVEFQSSQTQRNRKFVSSSYYLEGYNLHPNGHSIGLTTRGKPFTFANWEGPAIQHGEPDGVRYRLLTWLNDGKRLIAVSDSGGEERFVILDDSQYSPPQSLSMLDIGRPLAIEVSPTKDALVFSNHRYELCHLDLETEALTIIDRGHSGRISGFDWSPDGNWVAYGISVSHQRTALQLWEVESGTITPLTVPLLDDYGPSFDPDGRYLYLLSYRQYNPVYDRAHFNLAFPHGSQPYLITLQKETPSPFIPVARAPGQKVEHPGSPYETETAPDEKQEDDKKSAKPKLRIDLEGIQNRLIKFPVRFSIYGRIMGLKGSKVLYTRYPVSPSLPSRRNRPIPAANANLYSYDLNEGKEESVINGITGFDLSRNKEILIYRAGNRLRILKADSRPSGGSRAGRASGWVDLERAKVSIVPVAEWRQMYREAWRLQRDHFWSPDMSQVDWLAVYERYLPLVERVGSRVEFSDLMWEMQGELGTSHCYENGGDYRYPPLYSQGKLGADVRFNADMGAWEIQRIVQGDIWDKNDGSPLLKPGLDVAVGDRIVAINGRLLSPTFSPQQALVHLAKEEVSLTLARGEADPHTITITTLRTERPARYREWVETNRQKVHEATNGRIGYIHIPDMGAEGFAEFYRSYLAEIERDGLLLDVRYNRGGNISQLLLEKLSRRPVGYRPTRWSDNPTTIPSYAVRGPLVALTDQNAASDGDIFSHTFKLRGLGPLVGKRTWGGVVGIFPRHALVDKTVTTQPEFATWFPDVGWGVENYGTDPDIEIDNAPQDYAANRDAQLERAITEILRLLAENPPQAPTFDSRPNLQLPTLPE